MQFVMPCKWIQC